MTKGEAREKCLNDPVFLAGVLGYDIEENPHRALFDALLSGKSKKLVLWPRGHFKTSAVCVYIVLQILKDPDIRIAVMQSSLKNTKLWLKEIRSHFDGTNSKSKLPALFPDFCGDKKVLKANAEQFTVPARKRGHLQQATVTAASPRAVSTGQHYNLLVFDDLVTANNFRNVELLDQLESEYSHFLPLLDPGGQVLVTGTRYSHADLYARIIQKDKGVNEWEISIRECWDSKGNLLFPERVTKDGRKIGFTPELLSRLQTDDPEMFGPQYLNKVLIGKDQLFPSSLLMTATRSRQDKDYPANAPVVFMIDPAFSRNRDSDHSVVAIGRQDGFGRVWIDDVVGSTYSPSALALVVLTLAVKHRPVRVLIEKQAGAEVLGEYINTLGREKGLRLPIDYHKAGNQKNAKFVRIAALESSFKGKRLFLVAGISDAERMEQEFTEFPRGRHDDRPDAISMLVQYMTGNVPQRAVIPTPSPYVMGIPEMETPKSNGPSCGYGFAC